MQLSSRIAVLLLLLAAQLLPAWADAPYPRAWLDRDGDCQNSRQEALIAQSTAPVRFATEHRCRVVSGRWFSPYTGEVIHDASAIDIDHVVPLQWAWTHGAAKWSYERWMNFVNDPANLLSVEARLNRQKGAKGLDRWLPPANACQYVLRFLRVMKQYRLVLNDEERLAYKVVREESCAD